MIHQFLMFHTGRIDKMSHAEFPAPLFLVRVHVNANDLVRTDHSSALQNIEANTAKAENDHIGAGLNLGRVDHRANTGGHTAADVTDVFKRRFGLTLARAISGSTVWFAKVEQPM